jgi:hypothetical protein
VIQKGQQLVFHLWSKRCHTGSLPFAGIICL